MALYGAEVPIADLAGLEVIDLRSVLRREEGNGGIRRRSLEDVNYLVVHHSGVAVDSTAEAINNYHIDHNGWPGIGYHFLVHWDGRREYVADIQEIRYSVASRNYEIVAVCLTGDFRQEPPPAAALESARLLLAHLKMVLARDLPVVGHRDITPPQYPTACPGDTWPQWRENLTSSQAPPEPNVYIVQPGDTLWRIAQDNGTTVEELARINQLDNPHLIRVGQKLIIDRAIRRYVVKPGDTLWRIARDNSTTVDDLLRYNQWITDRNLIRPGEEILLP